MTTQEQDLKDAKASLARLQKKRSRDWKYASQIRGLKELIAEMEQGR